MPLVVMRSNTRELTFLDKVIKNSKEQPLVPLGTLLTCGALALSARALKRGDSKQANKFFFWRVGFQGFTVAVLLVGAYMMGNKGRDIQLRDREKELREKAKLREGLWIQELERLDEEEKQRLDRALSVKESFEKRREASAAQAAQNEKDRKKFW